MRAGWMKRAAVLGLTSGLWAGMLTGISSCGHQNSQGQSPSYLIIDSMVAASGATPTVFSGTLQSDVLTLVKVLVGGTETLVPTIYEDGARVNFKMALKDPGTLSLPTQPTATNSITITRYRVEYKRADGRNTQGVDVPYAFDGAATATIGSVPNTLSFIVVRAQAKQEMPLSALRNGGGANLISTIAYVTFYGQDQNGNAVSVTGALSVDFGDWGDPG